MKKMILVLCLTGMSLMFQGCGPSNRTMTEDATRAIAALMERLDDIDALIITNIDWVVTEGLRGEQQTLFSITYYLEAESEAMRMEQHVFVQTTTMTSQLNVMIEGDAYDLMRAFFDYQVESPSSQSGSYSSRQISRMIKQAKGHLTSNDS